MNKIALLVIVLVTTLGMGLAASLGIFSATTSETSVAEEIETVSSEIAASDVGLTASEQSQAAMTESEENAAQERSREAERQVALELKLQEVRDSYLSFGQAFPQVVVHYSEGDNSAECAGEPACVLDDSGVEIVVDKTWALNADQKDMKSALARAHADIAFGTLWDSRQEALNEIENVISMCEIEEGRDASLVRSPTASADTDELLTFEAMRDVIVSVMVAEDAALAVYPQDRHTQNQIEVATDIASGIHPTIVVPAADKACS
ncbi:hypothetical protein [Timonella sp. A28]|uniref:hypothetical protein n=1 Tax=Timonella sp. A28 TaxID=3442640 RepID=UPI003EB9464D